MECMLPEEIIRHIISYARPQYPYIQQLHKIFENFDKNLKVENKYFWDDEDFTFEYFWQINCWDEYNKLGEWRAWGRYHNYTNDTENILYIKYWADIERAYVVY